MSEVLVNHPWFGSLWLSDAYLKTGEDGREYVIGWYWDTGEVGSPYLPDDFMGESIPMNFPATCIRKTVGELARRAA